MSSYILNSTKTELLIDPRFGPQSLLFKDRTQVPTADSVKYLGSLVSWNKPFETAFYHRRALTVETYKKLRLVWNSRLPRKAKLRFLSVFIPTLLYGLDAFTLTTPQIKRLNISTSGICAESSVFRLRTSPESQTTRFGIKQDIPAALRICFTSSSLNACPDTKPPLMTRFIVSFFRNPTTTESSCRGVAEEDK